MAEDSKNLTSFKTHRQQYRFKVMSFGLKNASATFQREMNKALSCYREFSRAYIDDIAIFSKNWEEHLLHLDTILTKLSELNFTVNLKSVPLEKLKLNIWVILSVLVARTRSRKDCSYQQLTSA
ncbi:retrovirus-related Pol polyprotein from transposon 17.6 [Trichonephila clavipes]|nr:retrovirus-related Pol polyprotein from transposon 17.6 [Trichonephila clavipes]